MDKSKIGIQINTIKSYIKEYGNVSLLECIDKLKGKNIHKCPKCDGDGVLSEIYNAYPTNLPDSGWVDDIQTRYVTCGICNGIGFTEEKMEPIIKIVGYKKSE